MVSKATRLECLMRPKGNSKRNELYWMSCPKQIIDRNKALKIKAQMAIQNDLCDCKDIIYPNANIKIFFLFYLGERGGADKLCGTDTANSQHEF